MTLLANLWDVIKAVPEYVHTLLHPPTLAEEMAPLIAKFDPGPSVELQTRWFRCMDYVAAKGLYSRDDLRGFTRAWLTGHRESLRRIGWHQQFSEMGLWQLAVVKHIEDMMYRTGDQDFGKPRAAAREGRLRP